MIWPSSAFSNWLEGTSTFLMMPSMSVNWSRMKWTSSFLQRVRIAVGVVGTVKPPGASFRGF